MAEQNSFHSSHEVRPSLWALRYIALHPVSLTCVALRQLIVVAEEKRRQSISEHDREVEVLLSRFVEWPLPVLTRCASILHVFRGVVKGWINTVQATAPSPPTRSQLSTSPAATSYQRLYNICLWQRRHPLFILTPVLDTFGVRLSCQALNDMLEALSDYIVGSLNDIPHLLRCDVLMTYPRLPFHQQLQLMKSFRMGYVLEECEAPPPPPPPPPELYIGEHVRHVPPRFGSHHISAEKYVELRRAFELHKRAGIRRLLACTP
ncbi:hypothetical protein MOQ_009830 [Trypanosoma cruzi marinkellei]|uniref:Uncharacterized protein n=1 Tax=Trypanosoma cruzi marinkellei TaxID=85056 RepID=K2MVQ0_TRYCR|nr:hypothetical protein MOQ_009830 [Trypanosoma cruzi marinkellei]